MKHGMFCVLDVKAKAFIPPFVLPNNEMAVRAFADCVRDPAHMFAKHPEDYHLHRIGTFDDETGAVECGVATEMVCTALQIAKRQAEQVLPLFPEAIVPRKEVA